MPTYVPDRPWLVRDFTPERLRVPPELLAGLGCNGGNLSTGNYISNTPPANLTPPTISTLLLPTNQAVSTAAGGTSASPLGLGALVIAGGIAFLLFGGSKTKNPRRNVEMGYWVGAGGKRRFHPIRASYDYSAKRAGEGRKKKATRKRRRK